MKDLITIIIPCKNEEQYIGRLLTDLLIQRELEDVLIIIADANSTDNTLEIIKFYQQLLNIEVIEGGSVSVGRNNGALLATTPYILFLDADVRFFNHNAIRDAVNHIHHKSLDLVTLSPKNYGTDWRASLLFKGFGYFNKLFTKFTPFAIGAFFLTRRSKFVELDMFPNKYHTSEDYILSVQYNPKKFAIVNHYFGQDERRFNKLGYWGMLKYMTINFFNRNNLRHFEKTNVKYWD
jgi:glycosyltransferase involved in cell wall biosynthesis